MSRRPTGRSPHADFGMSCAWPGATMRRSRLKRSLSVALSLCSAMCALEPLFRQLTRTRGEPRHAPTPVTIPVRSNRRSPMRTLRLLLLHAVTTLVLMTMRSLRHRSTPSSALALQPEGPRKNCGRGKRPRIRRRRKLKLRRRRRRRKSSPPRRPQRRPNPPPHHSPQPQRLSLRRPQRRRQPMPRHLSRRSASSTSFRARRSSPWTTSRRTPSATIPRSGIPTRREKLSQLRVSQGVG